MRTFDILFAAIKQADAQVTAIFLENVNLIFSILTLTDYLYFTKEKVLPQGIHM